MIKKLLNKNSTLMPNSPIKQKVWIIKAGSSLITNHGKGLDQKFISSWVEQVVKLKQQGIQVVLVSSGAVAEGLVRLNIDKRPSAIHELQAAAAVGQMGLIQRYENEFQKHQLHTAQILLTHDDLSNRQRYLNARSTLKTLLKQNVVPIVNENDTIAIDEIRFGDNDTLAALVANLMDADRLVLLTDQNGMYDSDPNTNPDARLISSAHAGDPQLLAMAGNGSAGKFGRGGMFTKVRAAEKAALSGTETIIAGGHESEILLRLAQNEQVGTWIHAKQSPVAAKKQWLAGHLQTKGKLTLDSGAHKVISGQGKSLLPVGVKECSGHFKRGEAVACIDETGQQIAVGLINYSSEETRRIIGKPSSQISGILGYVDEPELIHRDNLVILI
ncbi:MAG: glutamate 5-kinase [Gammaproteobacteria bacterium]|nr:glutamate 5-kinase [Gammaproteobacteria bacterium]